MIEVKKFGLMEIGFVASTPWVGAVLGAVIGGVLSDRVFGERRKPVMMITAGSSVITMYGLIHAPNDPIALGALLMLTGFLLNLGYSTHTVYPMGLVERQRVPFAVAIISTLGAIGSGISPVVVGFILDHAGWDTAFSMLSACSVVAFLLLTMIIEPRMEAMRCE